ncbi:hypothetical protein KR009_011290, partial [Drosophila setifemur]
IFFVAFRVLLLLAGGLQVVFAQFTNVCLHQVDGTRLPLATHCGRFVVCQKDEVSIIGSCPRGLHFNRELGECDFQWRANCLGLAAFAGPADQCNCECCADECQDPIDEETETTAVTEDCDTSTTTTKSPVADTSTTTTTTKAPGTDTTGETDLTETTTAVDDSTDSTNSSNTTPSSPELVAPTYCASSRPDCADKKSGTMLEMPGVCVRFIQCANGCVEEITCPSGTYFNATIGQCDNWWNVDCTPTADDDDEVVGPSGTTCSSQGVCTRQRDGVKFSDPESNGYFVCQCQCPIAMPCPGGLTFNETAQVCDWPKTSEDDSSGSSALLCADNLVYNATSNQCNYPADYVPEVACNTTSTVCDGQKEGENFPVPGKCNMFYKCNYNCAVEQWCPNNLIYDPDYDICNYPEYVDCEWDYTPPSGPNAGPSGIACESNGRCLMQKEGKRFRSTTSCGKYVICQCECEVEMECPEGLYWDENLETCNYASEVSCSL